MKLKRIGIAYAVAAVLVGNTAVFAEVVDSVSITENKVSISGKTEKNDIVGIYKMKTADKAYGIDETLPEDIENAVFLIADESGNYLYEGTKNDNTSMFYISTRSGKNKLVDKNGSVSDIFAKQFFVGPDGSNVKGNGTYENPYATLEKVQYVIENYQNSSSYKGGDIVVNILPGTYRLNSSVDFKTSGTDNGRIIYRAYNGGDVIFKNSVKINVNDLHPITDLNTLNRLPKMSANKVCVADLRDYVSDGDYIGYGFLPDTNDVAHCGTRGNTRLFLNDKPQTISRWPNVGYKDLYLSDGVTSSVINPGSENDDITLKIDDNDISRWKTADDMVIRDYFFRPYWGEGLLVKSIDSGNSMITLDNIYKRAINVSESYAPQRRWYAENLLEELDLPGEYYIDEKNKKLYYYPPYDLNNDDCLEFVKGSAGINMFNIYASHLSFEGLKLMQANYKGMTSVSAHDIVIDNCEIGYVRSTGVQFINDVDNIIVKNSVIYNCGGPCIMIEPKNITVEQTANLESSGIEIYNNHLYRSGENSMYPHCLINTSGVKDVVKNNTMHFSPIGGVGLASAGGVFDNNEVYNVLYDGSDSGGTHIGGDWQKFGISYSYNFFHDIGPENFKDGMSTWPLAGIYWDETHSFTTQNNNIIVNDNGGETHGIFMNGGRNHTAKGNIIVGAKYAFRNPDTHSSYLIADTDNANEELTGRYNAFKQMYEYAKKNNTIYYRLYGKEMDELFNDVETNTHDHFSAKNLDFENNVIADCGNEGEFGQSLSGQIVKGDRTGKHIFIDNTATVKLDNFVTSDSRDEIFINPIIGDYRISDSGKIKLGIDDNSGFKLDKTFDISGIGCKKLPELGDKFKKIYPLNGQVLCGSKKIELAWEPAAFADKYEYTVYDENSDVVKKGTTMYTVVDVSDLPTGHTYTWDVKAKYCSFVYSAVNGAEKIWNSEGEHYMFSI